MPHPYLTGIFLATGILVHVSGHGSSIEPPEKFTVCFDFSCKTTQEVQISSEDWHQVTSLFLLNGDAKEERQRIREAVAELERIVGTYTPTHRDVALNGPYTDEPSSKHGQMDCIDESINTTTYLRMMERAGLLKFHLVRDRAYRQSLLNQHWAAQIVDTRTGKYYVVDSWFEDNGELPIMVTGETWHDLSWF